MQTCKSCGKNIEKGDIYCGYHGFKSEDTYKSVSGWSQIKTTKIEYSFSGSEECFICDKCLTTFSINKYIKFRVKSLIIGFLLLLILSLFWIFGFYHYKAPLLATIFIAIFTMVSNVYMYIYMFKYIDLYKYIRIKLEENNYQHIFNHELIQKLGGKEEFGDLFAITLNNMKSKYFFVCTRRAYNAILLNSKINS